MAASTPQQPGIFLGLVAIARRDLLLAWKRPEFRGISSWLKRRVLLNSNSYSIEISTDKTRLRVLM